MIVEVLNKGWPPMGQHTNVTEVYVRIDDKVYRSKLRSSYKTRIYILDCMDLAENDSEFIYLMTDILDMDNPYRYSKEWE